MYHSVYIAFFHLKFKGYFADLRRIKAHNGQDPGRHVQGNQKTQSGHSVYTHSRVSGPCNYERPQQTSLTSSFGSHIVDKTRREMTEKLLFILCCLQHTADNH